MRRKKIITVFAFTTLSACDHLWSEPDIQPWPPTADECILLSIQAADPSQVTNICYKQDVNNSAIYVTHPCGVNAPSGHQWVKARDFSGKHHYWAMIPESDPNFVQWPNELKYTPLLVFNGTTFTHRNDLARCNFTNPFQEQCPSASGLTTCVDDQNSGEQ